MTRNPKIKKFIDRTIGVIGLFATESFCKKIRIIKQTTVGTVGASGWLFCGS